MALGCPHCSREELERIADLLAGQRVQREMWVCTARKIRDSCPELVERIESSGARVFCDTCMVVSPATEGFGRMMVNSGKALVYLPGLGGGCRLRQPGRVHRCRFGEEEMTEIPCHKVASGFASGPALTTRMAISFLGNVDPRTGMVVDPGHELYGQKISGKVLIFPGGKGSTVGSYVIYQLKKRGLAPAAMINLRSEPIVAVGAIISGIPLVDRVPADLLQVKNGSCIEVDSDRERVRIRTFQNDPAL